MNKFIHKNTVEGHKSASGKAIYLTVRFGTSGNNDRVEWFPVSQLTIGEYNECGWAEVVIPSWLIRSKGLERASFIELEEE